MLPDDSLTMQLVRSSNHVPLFYLVVTYLGRYSAPSQRMKFVPVWFFCALYMSNLPVDMAGKAQSIVTI